jgi:tRNA modification GTPase
LSEDVVVCRTGPASLEIHCHGGNVAVDRILDSLAAVGVEVVPASQAEWLWNSPVDAACQSLLQRAATQRTALLLVDQAELWSRELERFQQEADPDRRQSRLAEIAAWESFAHHLTEPWNVVLCGRPNAGKSSLMNVIAGFARSIVHAVAGTTRDVVTYETAIDGWPVRFSDTAGLRETADPLESQGVQRTHSAIAAADLVIGLFDLSEPPTTEDNALWQALPPSALRIGNKSDLEIRWPADRLKEVERISARTGDGVPNLLAQLCDRLIPALPPSGLPLPIDPAWRTWLEVPTR